MTVYNKDVICPFYQTLHAKTKKEASKVKKSIGCEGINDTKEIVISFPTERKREIFSERHCCSFSYKKCPIAKMIMEVKYGERSG